MLNFPKHSFSKVYMINGLKCFRILRHHFQNFAIWHFPYISHLFLLPKHKLFIFVRKILYKSIVRSFYLRDTSSFFKHYSAAIII